MLKELEGLIKFIIKIFTSKMVNVLVCFGFRLNIINNYSLTQLLMKLQLRLLLFKYM